MEQDGYDAAKIPDGTASPDVASWAGDENAEAMVLRLGQRIVRATNVILDALLGAGGGRLEESEERGGAMTSSPSTKVAIR